MNRKIYTSKDYISINGVVNILINHVNNNIPISISRLSDAELGVLYQDKSGDNGHNWWRAFCEISGVKLPNEKAKTDLIEALSKIDIMGIFVENNTIEEPYRELHNSMYRDTQLFFDEYNIYPAGVFYCFDHFRIPALKSFVDLLIKEPPLLIGNTVKPFADLLKSRYDIDVKGIISCADIFDVDNVIKKSKDYDYKWAIVSAGTPAKIICSKLTKEFNKTTLDLGNVVNRVIDGEYSYCYLY